METSLQNASLTASQLDDSLATGQIAEEQHHIHLPNPSLWPFILSVALVVTLSGVLFFPTNPWLTVVAAPFVLVGILGWALEDPMAAPYDEAAEAYRYVYNPAITPHDVLEEAEELVDRVVTVSSTAYSTHPVKVEIDQVKDDGVILPLYGKVELEARRHRRLVRILAVSEVDRVEIPRSRGEHGRRTGLRDGAHKRRIVVENYSLS